MAEARGPAAQVHYDELKLAVANRLPDTQGGHPRNWVADQIDTGQPLWLPAQAAGTVESQQSLPQNASPGEAS